MKILLTPLDTTKERHIQPLVPVLLLLSAIIILISPLHIDQSYSWTANSISESAAQNLKGAWITRLGFICFGLAVLALAAFRRRQWARGAYWFHLCFGVFMVSTAAFSHKPWLQNVPFDHFEDFLHSFTATAMGFAFSFGVLVRLLQRAGNESSRRAFDIVALVAATAIPLVGWYWQDVAGLVQRLLFLVAYLWYGHEAVRS